jgi:uncharacterized protein YcbX
MDRTELGRVAALWRYPVKSMAGEPLDRADVSWHGIAGDRRWAFVRPGHDSDGFPWLTIRECPELARYRPRLVDPAHPDASAVRVQTPAGGELDVVDPTLAAELGAGVMKLDRGAFDTFPLSLISWQTIAALGELVGRELAVARFRPNIVIDGAEDAWVGATIRIGDARLRVDKRDKRCVVVNCDPVTGERDPMILRTIGRARDAYLGVYVSVATPGAIAVGDPIIRE